MIPSSRVAAIASLMAVASTLAIAQTTGTLAPQPPPGVAPSPPPATTGQFSSNELIDAGHRFFGSVSDGLAMVVEKAVSQWGLPNGYVLGQEASGAFRTFLLEMDAKRAFLVKAHGDSFLLGSLKSETSAKAPCTQKLRPEGRGINTR